MLDGRFDVVACDALNDDEVRERNRRFTGQSKVKILAEARAVIHVDAILSRRCMDLDGKEPFRLNLPLYVGELTWKLDTVLGPHGAPTSRQVI